MIAVRRGARRTHRLPWSKWQGRIFSRYICTRQGPAQEVLGHSGDSLSLSVCKQLPRKRIAFRTAEIRPAWPAHF